MKARTILAACAATLSASITLLAGAQSPVTRAPFWPPVGNSVVFSEWYSDLPWHQKLGTYAGNQVDVAIMMPYDALPQADRDGYCKGMTKADCMIEIGVTNILGMERIDTPYNFADPKWKGGVPAECKDSTLPCVEVLLRVSNRYAKTSGSTVILDGRLFGPSQPDKRGVFTGYTISDGSAYAPQMPWFMSHYCEAMFKPFPSNPTVTPDIQDPVCYADYLSPFNNGFSGGLGTAWPRGAPWSPWPQDAVNHCTIDPKVDEGKVCNMALAGFDLQQVPPKLDKSLQYSKYNDFLMQWFNNGLAGFKADVSPAANFRKFPWTGSPMKWEDFYPYSATNPFIGTFTDRRSGDPDPAHHDPVCDTTLTGPLFDTCKTTVQYAAAQWLYPRQCSLEDLRQGNVERLRKCGLNYELHHNGWYNDWPEDWRPPMPAPPTGAPPGTVPYAMTVANQYGRTSFLFAGVPGMQLPVSHLQVPGSPNGMTVYEQVYNTSIFSLYIPIANEADQTRAINGRNYTNPEFYHTLLMTNHMEAKPEVFADGIRGKVLWHNEYRTQAAYIDGVQNPSTTRFPPVTFNASFSEQTAPAPFHNSTCDGCHVRNASGVPINTKNWLDAVQRVYMKDAPYSAHQPAKDYTFTGEIKPMKLVFFDVGSKNPRADASRYSTPLAFTPLTRLSPPRATAEVFYTSAIMNYYGDAFHVTKAPYTYEWSFVPADDAGLVVKTVRKNREPNLDSSQLKEVIYTPWQVKVASFQTPADCQIAAVPAHLPSYAKWPQGCNDLNGDAIKDAIGAGQVGIMLLNGKRLGNSSAIEAMPDDAILGFLADQQTRFGETMAGEIAWTAGARNGIGNDGVVKKECRTNTSTDCFIGRFGWLGDRASLEDQVANAAFVEMNMISSEGYIKLYGEGGKTTQPIRYLAPNCGPANAACTAAVKGNSDLSERDIERMADYARWVGNPTRSEFHVQLKEVVEGEKVFAKLGCDSCHVIRKIPIDPERTMLTDAYIKRLLTHTKGTGANAIQPFLSYLGTDLLMHDMGYLSQVGLTDKNIRNPDGTVMTDYKKYVQKIRTPALKGLRFNRFITDAQSNVKNPGDPGCDFLMHDGRACDAIEAAFMHDGPAVKKLGMIEAMTSLQPADITNLRAFLYSL